MILKNSINNKYDYHIQELLGTGSFATVFKAKHIPTKRNVAVKVFEKCKLRDSAELESLMNEVRISSRADHPLIATLFETFEDENNFYISMELVPNDSLLSFINSSGGIGEGAARKLFAQLVLVLEYLHKDLNVIHRDLKAENILLDRYGNIRLIDFGLSKNYDPSAPFMSTICGSPAYAAPELVKGNPYTNSVDIWSIGVILFAMIAGFLPFDDQNMNEQLKKVINCEPEYPNNISPSLLDLLKRLLNKNPETRITLDKIKEHPWVFSSIANVGSLDQFRVVHIKFIDKDIVEELDTLGVNTENLIPSLLKSELTCETASYKILKKEKLGIDINEAFSRMRTHRASNASRLNEISSTSALPNLSPLSSRALGCTRGHKNVLSSPGHSVPPMPRLSPVAGLQIRTRGVPDSPLMNNDNVQRRSRAMTFLKKEIVSPIIEKGTNAVQRTFL